MLLLIFYLFNFQLRCTQYNAFFLIILRYCHLTLTVYNFKMMLLNVRRNFSSDQKVFKRLVLPVGDNWRFRIYLTEIIALSNEVLMSNKNLFFKLGVAGLKVLMKGKTYLDVFVLLCSASFRDENFTSARIFLATPLG